MKREDIIESIVTNTFWRGLCVQYVTKNREPDISLIDDLYQEFILVVLDTSEEKLLDINSKGLIDLWCYRIISNMWKSNTSQFYKKYREIRLIDIDDYLAFNNDDRSREEVLQYNRIMSVFNQAYEQGQIDSPKLYEMMTRIYIDVGSFREMEKELGINFMTCKRYVDRFRDIVKTSYNKLLMDNDEPK